MPRPGSDQRHLLALSDLGHAPSSTDPLPRGLRARLHLHRGSKPECKERPGLQAPERWGRTLFSRAVGAAWASPARPRLSCLFHYFPDDRTPLSPVERTGFCQEKNPGLDSQSRAPGVSFLSAAHSP